MYVSDSIDLVALHRHWLEHSPVRRIGRLRLIDIDGGRYVIPARFAVTFFGRRGAPDVELEIAVDDAASGLRVTMLTLTPPADEHEVARIKIRGIPSDDLAFVAAAEATYAQTGHPDVYHPSESESQSLAMLAALRQSLRPRRRITREHLEAVSEVYRAAVRDGSTTPVVVVAERFGVARPTAAGWIKQARRAGILAPTTRGRVSA